MTLYESFNISFSFSKAAQHTGKSWTSQLAKLNVIRLDVFSEGGSVAKLTSSSPFNGLLPVFFTYWEWVSWELSVFEAHSCAKLLLNLNPVSIAFKWLNNFIVSMVSLVNVFVFKVFCYFFKFSNVSWTVKALSTRILNPAFSYRLNIGSWWPLNHMLSWLWLGLNWRWIWYRFLLWGDLFLLNWWQGWFGWWLRWFWSFGRLCPWFSSNSTWSE